MATSSTKQTTNHNHYIKQGNLFFIASKENLNIHDRLPAENFIVKFDTMQNRFYLQNMESFELPPELYGKIGRHSDRILETFKSRPRSTGVFLEGEKGSGKTLLAQVLSLKVAKELNSPTLIVTEPFCGDAFNKFIQDVNQPCVVLFDEFEKVYHEDEMQSQLLTLLDGVFQSKKLFVLTCNEKFKVNSNLKNRPGRLFYMLSFGGLEEDFIREYCEKKLNKNLVHHTSQVVSVANTVYKFNFDMLKALVEEMNRYNESPKDSVEMLNIKPDSMFNDKFSLVYHDPNGDVIKKDLLDAQIWAGNLNDNENVYIYNSYDVKLPGKKRFTEVEIVHTNEDFESYDPISKSVVFVNREGYKVTLTKKVNKPMIDMSYNSLLA